MSRPTQIIIDLAAVRHNLQQIKKLAPNSEIIAMVKANAYGHGLIRMASALREADAFGVACLEEGTLLREAGIHHPIVLMEGLFSAEELPRVIAGNFTIVVHHDAQVAMLEQYQTTQPIATWLKIDTGMHRLGFQPSAVADVYQRLMNCTAVKKPIGLMTHFADADSLNSSLTQKQIALFQQTIQHFVGPKSLANSAGILAWPHIHADWIRPGIMLYGTSPFAAYHGREHGLEPVMALTSELIAVHDLQKGERVGYGATFECLDTTRLGVVAVGYGDGYPRHAKNGTPVLVNGERCPLAGRVSMDMITVDLSSQPHAKVGDPVVLWGKELPVEMIAQHSGTNCYELLTRITQRVRVVIMNEA